MGQLTQEQISEYCAMHIPYVHNALRGHTVLCNNGTYDDNPAILTAAFLGSLIAGRMILEFLGIELDQSSMNLICRPKRNDSVRIDDLGGKLVDLDRLREQPGTHCDICEYIRMAHKAAGHITVAEERPWPKFHDMVAIIDELLDQQMRTVPGANI